MISQLWKGAGRGARVGMAAGVLLILAAFLVSVYFMLRTSEQVLFGDLSERELASFAAELDRMKVPFRVGPDGASVLVAESQAQDVRLKLAGRDIPIHGGVGFELFGQGDFGMTDFAQRVNYQRALQGELARTVMSLAEVREARVHVALPEEGLFRRQPGKAKASVTLSMKPGRLLRAAQVAGIQSLVASAVPGVAAQEVTVIDQDGVALTRPAQDGGEGSAGAAGRLDLKRELEQHLGRKATDVLERAVGAGKAFASVDVTLNMDAVRVTTEDVLPSGGSHPDRTAAGVMVRERSSTRSDPSGGEGKDGARVPSGQREVEYQAGRRIEQVVIQPGAIRQLQVVAVVPEMQDEAQLARLERLLGAAVGANLERGDTVLLQPAGNGMSLNPATRDEPAAMPPVIPPQSPAPKRDPLLSVSVFLIIAAVVGMVVAGIRRQGGRKLTARQRILMLQRIQDWLEQPSADAGSRPAGPARNGAGKA